MPCPYCDSSDTSQSGIMASNMYYIQTDSCGFLIISALKQVYILIDALCYSNDNNNYYNYYSLKTLLVAWLGELMRTL